MVLTRALDVRTPCLSAADGYAEEATQTRVQRQETDKAPSFER